jgi:multisubunit Na+/H+ antiporter MnhG subunit
MVFIHVIILIGTLFYILSADSLAIAWMRDVRTTLNRNEVRRYHRNVSIGLGLMIVSGGFMFFRAPEWLLSNPAFIAKMVFVAFLILNSVAIHFLMNIAIHKSYKEVPKKQRAMLIISGGVSIIGWIGAIVCGLLL